jgi:hypothetical protein
MKINFRRSRFRENLQMIIASAFAVFFQHDADWLDDLMFQRTFFRPSGFDDHDIIARGLFFQNDQPQRNVIRHRMFVAVKSNKPNAHRAAIKFANAFAKLFPKLLWNFRCHKNKRALRVPLKSLKNLEKFVNLPKN